MNPSTREAVLQSTTGVPSEQPIVRGFDWDKLSGESHKPFLQMMFDSYKTTGFQSTNLALAADEIDRMLHWRLSDDPIAPEDDEEMRQPEVRANVKCKIYLGYTSNMISSGVRETIKFLVKNKLVDVIVTTAGGIEEDIIKCITPSYMGDFSIPGRDLRVKGINRIGNLLVPNDNYCKFEDFMNPLLDKMLEEQKTQGVNWTPSKIIHRLGLEINHEDSVCYWAAKNNIPIFCPALTDGSLGDMIYFHSFKNPGLVVDIVEDIRAINNTAAFARKTGMIILGGGVIKHHICNANLMRNGADFSVYINTGHDFDGSDSGAPPDEAISWGKIRLTARPIKVHGEASILFPLIVAQTFARYLRKQKPQAEN
eukprot:TRINITY_DN7225_c0_g1_i1.p1 TRINITY_DN7225_c0_g1~~TRINITY_DN7225_c0_g1_i1.p1  ORF type:complete len:368 (+),score=89.07 TRINITY_DN7225_c0_g1_i1:56-1159(+)